MSLDLKSKKGLPWCLDMKSQEAIMVTPGPKVEGPTAKKVVAELEKINVKTARINRRIEDLQKELEDLKKQRMIFQKICPHPYRVLLQDKDAKIIEEHCSYCHFTVKGKRIK